MEKSTDLHMTEMESLCESEWHIYRIRYWYTVYSIASYGIASTVNIDFSVFCAHAPRCEKIFFIGNVRHICVLAFSEGGLVSHAKFSSLIFNTHHLKWGENLFTSAHFIPTNSPFILHIEKYGQKLRKSKIFSFT